MRTARRTEPIASSPLANEGMVIEEQRSARAEKQPPNPTSLGAMLERIGHLLPMQNPLDNFVHHNTLHSFEHLDFREGVQAAAELYDARPWGTMAFYREAYLTGRILDRDVDAVLIREIEPKRVRLPGLTLSKRDLTLRLMLAPDTGLHEPEASAWALHEQHYIEQLPATLNRRSVERLRALGPPDTVVGDLWRACRAIAKGVRRPTEVRRLADEVELRLDRDLDALMEPDLIRWATAFLDVGQAAWAMPGRDQGFFRTTLDHLAGVSTLMLPGGAWLRREARRLRAEGVGALEAACESLIDIGVDGDDAEAFVTATLLALPGLAGMFQRFADRPDLAPGAVPPASTADFLAIRLLLERGATRFALRQANAKDDDSPLLDQLAGFRSKHVDPHAEFIRVGPAFHVALTLGLRPADLRAATRPELRALRRLTGKKYDWRLRWLWHLAYERRYRVEVLDAMVLHGQTPMPEPPEPHTQVLACIDDREESLRRHLEEVDAGYETYGYAGHYGVAVRFQGVGETAARALCPASMDPTHALVEVATDDADLDRFELSTLLRDRMLGGGGGGVGLLGGALRAVTGSLALVPMAWRLLFPEESASAHRRSAQDTPTRLSLVHEPGSPDLFGLPVGFTDDEMADIVASALTDMGLVEHFAPLVVVLGHGSTSVNNPHAAGYNCGACSGGRGGPNARAFAAMGNRAPVRERLARRGIHVPDETWFLGGLHDTASDEVRLYDLDLVPEALAAQIDRLERDLAVAGARDAHERCRRFLSAPLDLSDDEALRHAVGRTEDLAQARPEYNHVANASCIVGKRRITQGLFLDHRAFLVSYDLAADPDAERLGQILSSVGPVGAGINLEYFFSFIDNERYGAGTKLPHNVVGLIGVMNGSSSDLRTGLVEQMVEIHEPMRLLVVIEGDPDHAQRAVAPHEGLRKLVDNRWILVATYDPATGKASFLEPSGWVEHEVEAEALPTAASSKDWYGGHRGALPPARITNSSQEVEPC